MNRSIVCHLSAAWPDQRSALLIPPAVRLVVVSQEPGLFAPGLACLAATGVLLFHHGRHHKHPGIEGEGAQAHGIGGSHLGIWV